MSSIHPNTIARRSIFFPSLGVQAHSAFGVKEVFCKITKMVFHYKIKWLSTKGSQFEQGRLQIHKSGELPLTYCMSKVSTKGAGVEEHPVNCRSVKSPSRL